MIHYIVLHHKAFVFKHNRESIDQAIVHGREGNSWQVISSRKGITEESVPWVVGEELQEGCQSESIRT